MSRQQCFVVGGGVVGLAVARALSRSLEVVLLEARPAIGSQTSSRNSEVVHSGIYYAPGSLKARLCAPGSADLYEYMAQRRVDHRMCGKIICATSEAEAPKIKQLMALGERNGVEGLKALSAADMQAMEPSLRGTCGLWVPSAGLMDSHQLMLALQADAEANGAVIVTNCCVTGGRVADTTSSTGQKQISIFTDQGTFDADVVINCAGHLAPSVAARIQGHPLYRVPQPYYCKGSYFKLTGVKPPFHRLVYPVPAEHGLGVHATIDLCGATKFGPDTEWVEPRCPAPGIVPDAALPLPDWVYKTFCEKDYFVSPERCESFYAEIRKYWPDIPDDALVPDYSGFRPKIAGPLGARGTPNSVPGRDLSDFVIEGPKDHGVEGLINLYGIESPGLTACLSIARYVEDKLSEASK
jgi:L-2-hydroxyglutarate oxidase LhgO